MIIQSISLTLQQIKVGEKIQSSYSLTLQQNKVGEPGFKEKEANTRLTSLKPIEKKKPPPGTPPVQSH